MHEVLRLKESGDSCLGLRIGLQHQYVRYELSVPRIGFQSSALGLGCGEQSLSVRWESIPQGLYMGTLSRNPNPWHRNYIREE